MRYVLEGSVQKSGDKVRITAQLIDAIRGVTFGASDTTGDKDIFALQDEITIKIMNGMSIELTEGEQARRWTKVGTDKPGKPLKSIMKEGLYMERSAPRKKDNDKGHPVARGGYCT